MKKDAAAVEDKLQKQDKERSEQIASLKTANEKAEADVAGQRTEKTAPSKLDRTTRGAKWSTCRPEPWCGSISAGMVHLNLGSADALHRQVNFSVFAADTLDHTKTAKKASLEVTEVLGDHLSEAAILEDKPGDPVTPGDKVYTLIWSPGERMHLRWWVSWMSTAMDATIATRFAN